METFPEPQEIETNPEAQEVMDEFREKRAGILGRIMSDRAAKITETVGMLAPGLDIVSLAAAAARGETLTGKTLGSTSRFNYAAAAGFLTFTYVLLSAGMKNEALAAKGMAATFGAMEFGPDFIEGITKIAEQRVPSMVPFIEKTAEFIASVPGLFENTRDTIMKTLENKTGYQSQELNG